MRIAPIAAALAPILALAAAAHAAELTGSDLIRALQRGGYVLVMRHASSPAQPPSGEEADPGNPNHERQLDAAGKDAATAMGSAIRKLHVRVGKVWSSPTYRALETARLAGFPKPTAAPELGDHGASMSATTGDQSIWLRAKAAEPPRRGTDTVLVTHFPNISAAFGDEAKGISDGEALVFRPSPGGRADLVGRIKIEDWPSLAK
jgi:phosphohistidine phosphatase SixA